MTPSEARFVWVFCFFDLPVGTKPQRKAATRFRKHLLDDGFLMLQFSVYARLARGEDAITKHIDRMLLALPKEGSVRVLQVTDTQYGRMKIMLGKASETETQAPKQLVLL